MTEVVTIPTCHRPEMLALTLESLSLAREVPPLVQIHADTPSNLSDIVHVRDLFYPSATVFYASSHIKAPSGCWNILQSIKEAARHAETVFFIEEDVRVYPEFFEWHRTQTSLASCGRWTRFNDIHGPLYTNPGSRLSRPLLDALIPHINDNYFVSLRGYLDSHFGTWPEMSELDDGLIRRVITRQLKGTATFPEHPVAVHQGWRMYDRIGEFKNEGTTIDERIHNLRLMHKRVSSLGRYSKDFESFLR